MNKNAYFVYFSYHFVIVIRTWPTLRNILVPYSFLGTSDNNIPISSLVDMFTIVTIDRKITAVACD